MVKKHSTQALTENEKKMQNERYELRKKEALNGKMYDFVVIGTGHAALVASVLLANQGKKVCLLEMHDIPGGYAHSFKMGDFYFCAQVHYIWGCHEGGLFDKFLKEIGIRDEIEFEQYDSEGYDVMVMPDGKKVKIPFGYAKLIESIEEAYPGNRKGVTKFCGILEKIHEEVKGLPSGEMGFWDFLKVLPKCLNLVKYRNATLEDVFNECGLSKEVRAVLSAGAGDFMAPPEKLSIFAFEGLFGGYNLGAFYPKKHFRFYIDRLVKFIKEKPGCDVFFETEVIKVNLVDGLKKGKKKVENVETADGKVFTGENYICNMDPQSAAKKLVGWENFTKQEQKRLSYKYSDSAMTIYLGLKDIDLKKFGYGNYNFWHLKDWDMNEIWKKQLAHDFEKPWVFMSTPTLHSSEPGIVPEGQQILEICTLVSYDYFKKLQEKSYVDYMKAKNELAERLLDFVEKHYVPDLRKHIAVKVVGTPVTNEDFVNAPRGNAYGSELSPMNFGYKRLRQTTSIEGFYWCNASAGYGGMYGTLNSGVMLVSKILGN